MALINQIKEAKKQKATNTTKVNKGAPTGLASKVASSKVSAPKASAGATKLSSKAQNYKPSSASGATNILNKVKESQGKTLTPTGAKVNTGKSLSSVSKNKLNPVIDETLRKLRPQEETSAELKSVTDQLNSKYKISPYSAVYDPETQALEKRRNELENESKLQEVKKERITIPEYQKAYEEAMSRGDKEEANRISETLNALDDSSLERVLKSGGAAAKSGFAYVANLPNVAQDISYERDARGYEEQYKRALAEGKTEEAEYYKMRAEESRKRAEGFDALGDSNALSQWAKEVRNESQKIMELERIGASGTDMVMMEVGDTVGNMAPSIASNMILPGSGLAVLGGQVFSSTYTQRIEEGYDMQVAVNNALATASIEVASEMLGSVIGKAATHIPGFSKLMDTAPAKVYVAISSKLDKYTPDYIQDMHSEGLEEVFSDVLQPWADYYTLGKEVEYHPGDIFRDYIMSYPTTLALGAFGVPSRVIKTSKQMYTAQHDLNILNECEMRYGSMGEEFSNKMEVAKRNLLSAINDFKEKSVVADAIKLESDMVDEVSLDDYMRMYDEALKPTFDRVGSAINEEINASWQRATLLEAKYLAQNNINASPGLWAGVSNDIKNEVRELADKGTKLDFNKYITETDSKVRQAMVEVAEKKIKGKNGENFDAREYMKLTPEQKANAEQIAKTAETIKGDVRVAKLDPGVNGYRDPDARATVVSVDQATTIDANKLMGMENFDAPVRENFKTEAEFLKAKNAFLETVTKEAGAQESAKTTVGHEVGHSIEETSVNKKVNGETVIDETAIDALKYLNGNYVDSYSDLKKAVTEYLGGEENFKKMADRIGAIYKLQNVDKFNAENEAVAFTVQTFAEDPEFFARVAKYNDSVAYSMYRDFMAALTGDKKLKVENAYARGVAQANRLSVEDNAYNGKMVWLKLVNPADRAKAIDFLESDGAEMIRDNNENIVSFVANDGSKQFNRATYNDSGREILENNLKEQVERGELTQKDADDIMSEMEYLLGMTDHLLDDSKDYEGFAKWADTKVELDANGNPVLSCVVSNGEYKMNIDFSRVCKKRATLNSILNNMISKGIFNASQMAEEDYAMINQIIREHGFEVACGLCFVDSKRYMVSRYATTFANPWNAMIMAVTHGKKVSDFNFGGAEGRNTVNEEFTPDYEALERLLQTPAFKSGENTKPLYRKMADLIEGKGKFEGRTDLALKALHTIEPNDMVSSFGMNAFKKDFPELYGIMNGHMGVAKPKTAHTETQYQNEILNMSLFDVAKAFEMGGVRFQSFSDFRANMYFDYMQAFADMAAKGLPEQSYTKEPAFAKLYGLTGAKINMSILSAVDANDLKELRKLQTTYKNGVIPPAEKATNILLRRVGLDANGNYVWGTETFPIEDAFAIQEKDGYDRNCGTILVGLSYEHIKKALADKRIKMVIPYHKSGLPHIVATMNNIEFFTDYTDFQNEGDATKLNDKGNPTKLTSEQKEQLNFNYYRVMEDLAREAMTQTDPALRQELLDEVPKRAAEELVRRCEELHFAPRFAQFAYNIIDGSTEVKYDAEGNPTNVERDVNGNTVINPDYYKTITDYSLYDRNGHFCLFEDRQGNLRTQDYIHMNFPENVTSGSELKSAATDYTMEQYISEILKDQETTSERLEGDILNMEKEVTERLAMNREVRAAEEGQKGKRTIFPDNTVYSVNYFARVKNAKGRMQKMNVHEEFDTLEEARARAIEVGETIPHYDRQILITKGEGTYLGRYDNGQYHEIGGIQYSAGIDAQTGGNTVEPKGKTNRISDINDKEYFTQENLEKGDPIEVIDYPKSNVYLTSETDVPKFFDEMITKAVNSGATEYRRGNGAFFNVTNRDTGNVIGVTSRVINEAISHKGNTFVTSSLLNLKPILENAVLVNRTTDGFNTYDVYFTHATIDGNDNLIRIFAENGSAVSVDSLAYSVSTTKGDSSLVTKNSTFPTRGTKFGGATITIANLLKEVNGTRFKGNLSADVQKELNSGVVIPNPDPKYTNQFSIGVTPQTEVEYDNAVRNNDTETAGRIVKEVANANGYTVEGYHGTRSFGFTKADVSKSDDGISFFVTTDPITAQTYSNAEVRRISEGVDSDTARKNILKRSQEFANVAKGVDAEKLADEIGSIALYYDDIEGTDVELRSYLKYDVLYPMYQEYENAAGENALEFEDWIEENEPLNEAYENLISSAFDYHNGDNGTYHFYINPDGVFEIDCKGSEWDSIKGDGKILPERNNGKRWDTRSISEWAKENGYAGVLFKNVIDDGNQGDIEVEEPADVYSLFNPQEQVKSADPITYDDQGNVIPLGERFNKKNNDLRYSMGLTNQSEDFVSEGIKPEQTERLKSGKIPAKVGRIIQKAYNAFDGRYSSEYEQFGLTYKDASDYLLEAAKEISKTGGMSQETLNTLRNVMYDSAVNVYEAGQRDTNAFDKVKSVLRKNPLSRSVIQEYKLSKANVKEMERNGIRFKTGGMDLGELEFVLKDNGLGDYFTDTRTFSDLEDFNSTLNDLRMSEGNTHTSSELNELGEEFDREFEEVFDDAMRTFVSDITGKQVMSDKTAEVIDSLDIPDEEFFRFVKRDPISPKALERIEKYKSQLTETAKEWIPNYDIIQEKHPEFTERELNDALFEILSEGTISESTANRIKDNLVQGLGVSSYAEANQSVKELVDDALDYFKADASYKMDKKAMNSVANKANTEIRSFTGNTASEGALDSYAKFENLEKTLEQVKKRRKAVAAENESMVKEFLAAGTDYGSSWMTLEQNLDKIAGTDSNLRQTLKDYFELPKYQSQIEYVQFLQKYGDTLQGLVKDGIRAGTKESAAVQYMLEGHTEDGATYTQKDLMTQFPKTWQKLDKAAKTLRGMYDEMYNLIESGRERTYGDIDAKYDLLMAKAREKANNARRTANELRQKLSEKADPKLEAMYNQANAEAEKLQRQYEQMVNDKASGDGTRRQKLQYRQNYAHHIYDRGGLSSFVDALMEDGSKVPTKLSGISNRAKPLSGFASFFQRQSKQKGYVADAIGGMSAYITDAAKIYAYDPYIEYLRFAANDIRLEASGNEMSRFVSWVDNYANGIAGKTQMLDRGIRETFGEKPLNMIRALNNQARKNAIVGNLSTALVQFANLPNAIGVLSKNGGAESALDIARGMSAYMSHLGRDGAEAMSPFMNARYYDINTQKGNALTRSANALTKTLLEFGDHEAAKMIWNSAYQQALRKNVDDPIMYADDLTRRSIAGRKVGELPLAMESQFLNLLMPFQVETNNTFHLMTGLLRDKEWKSALAMLIGGWLMNGLYEAIIGRRPITDPIDALWDTKDSENPMDVFTRLGGELLSAIPGSSYAVGLFGLDDNQRKKLFGENDPSRYGTGNIGLSAIGSALSDMYNYTEKRDPRYAMNATSDLFFNYVTPGGGRQMQRTIEGLQSEGMIPQYVNGEFVNEPRYYTPSGKVGFVNDPNDIFDVITAGTFGRWATKEGKEYLENGGKYLSGEAQRQLEALGGGYDAYNTVQALRDIKGVPNVKNSQALARRKYLEDQGLWDEFSSNMEGEWGDYGLNKTVGNATEEEFNELYREAFGANISNAAKPDTKKEADLSGLAGTPLERVAIQNLDMDEDVLQGVTDLGYDYKTIKQIDDYIDNTDSLRKEDGSAIRNTKALQMRQQYEELGVYDDIFQYISENGLDPQDYGLNKTVMGYSDSKFDSQYSKYFSGGSSSSSGSSSKKSSGRKSSGRKSSKKSSKTQAEKDQAFFEKLVAQIGTSRSTSSAIKSILKKSKSLRKSKGNSYEGLQDLIKDYYKAHPGADKSMFS